MLKNFWPERNAVQFDLQFVWFSIFYLISMNVLIIPLYMAAVVYVSGTLSGFNEGQDSIAVNGVMGNKFAYGDALLMYLFTIFPLAGLWLTLGSLRVFFYNISILHSIALGVLASQIAAIVPAYVFLSGISQDIPLFRLLLFCIVFAPIGVIVWATFYQFITRQYGRLAD